MVDTNNWRPTASGSEPAMDTSDWRAQLSPESRQRIVNRIWDTLKRCFSGQEGLQELKKFAVRFEEKIFIAATSQSDYLRIVSLKMLSMEKSENTILYSPGNISDSPDLEAAHGMQLQVHNPAQVLPISLSANQSQGSQQLLSQNVQNNMTTSGVQSSVGLQSAMPSVSGLTHTPIPIAGSQNPNMQNISGISQNSMGNSVGQGVTSNMFEAEQILMETNWRPTAPGGEPAIDTSDWRTQLPPESRQRIVNKILDTLKRRLPFSGQEGLQELKKIAVRFEEKMFTAATSQSDYLRKISLKMLSMENKSQSAIPNSAGNNSKPPDVGASHSMQPQVHNLAQALPIPLSANQSQGRQQLLSQNIQNNMTTSGFQTSLDSTAQTGHPSGGDWQEEIYQKVKAMKEMYLPDLNDMYQKIAVKLQQHESLSQQPKSDQLDKLKLFKTMLERLIAFLQVSKNNIVPSLKDKLAPYEKQIVNFINTNRPRNRIPALQQGQLLQFHLQSMQQPQSQISQVQSRENHMNPQLQTMNLQGSVPTMQQNNMSSLQQSSLSSLSGVSTSQQNIMNQLHPGSNLDSGQGNSLSSLQQVALQQNPASTSEQSNINTLSTQTATNLLRAQARQSLLQPSQQQLMPQIQSQPAQLQQQLGLQQQSNPLQRDIQQRLQASGQAPGSLLQTQDAIDQQKQIYQSQSVLPETSSTEMEDCHDTCNNVNNEDPYEYEGPIVQCWCNPPLKAPRWMSWSSNNPGRRFYSCPNYKKGNGCKFFEWHDKEAMPEYAKQVILELKETVETLRAEINCDYRQNEQLKNNYAQLKSQIHGSRKNVQIMVHDGNVENYGVFHHTALEENVMRRISVQLKIFVIASILFSLFLCISMKLV